jgi:hypothetical protein
MSKRVKENKKSSCINCSTIQRRKRGLEFCHNYGNMNTACAYKATKIQKKEGKSTIGKIWNHLSTPGWNDRTIQTGLKFLSGGGRGFFCFFQRAPTHIIHVIKKESPIQKVAQRDGPYQTDFNR